MSYADHAIYWLGLVVAVGFGAIGAAIGLIRAAVALIERSRWCRPFIRFLYAEARAKADAARRARGDLA